MPAFNEATIIERSLAELLDGLRSRGEPFEIVVVENGSTDDTAAIAAVDRRARIPRCACCTATSPTTATRCGRACSTRDGEIVVNFDCDYYDIGFIARAVDRMRDARATAARSSSARSARPAPTIAAAGAAASSPRRSRRCCASGSASR